MDYCIKLLLCYITMMTSLHASPQEYCSLDTFSPHCPQNEVIVMMHALYGRMKIGKCVKTDYGLQNCYLDSLSYFDRLCSGRVSCDVLVGIAEFNQKLSCIGELQPYLEASYKCLQVTTPGVKDCTLTGPLTLHVLGRSQSLASFISRDTTCGVRESPYILEAKPGQRINISLTDFYWDDIGQGCKRNYGYILDTTNDDVINICGGSPRTKTLLVSAGHQVQVLLEVGAVRSYNFLISYEALDCPDVSPPTHAWIKRQNDTITIGCQSSTQRWSLKCIGNLWIGYMGNCTEVKTTTSIVDQDEMIEVTTEGATGLPEISGNHLLAFGLICLTLIICCTTVALGCYCTKRYELRFRKKNQLNMYGYSTSGTHPLRFTYKPVTLASIPQSNASLPPYTTTTATPTVPARNKAYRGPMSAGYANLDPLKMENKEDDDDSVKYYVLENPNELGDNEREQLYQAMYAVNNKV